MSCVRGLRSSRAAALLGSLINNTRCGLSCNADNAVIRTSRVSTSPSRSTLLTKVHGHNTRQGLALLCESGDVSRRSTRQVQRRWVQAWTSASAVGGPSFIAGRLRPAAPAAISGLPTWSSFSTSDVPPTKDRGLTEEEGVDGVAVAAADVEPAAEPKKDEPRHAHIEMPSITDVGVNRVLLSSYSYRRRTR